MIKYDANDQARMMHIESEIVKRCGEFRSNTEAMLVAIAAMRVAKLFLEKYPENTQRAMIEEVFVPYLRGEKPNADSGTLIVPPYLRTH